MPKSGTPNGGTKELERTKSVTEVREPPMYKVILLNDHYTSMEFVVLVLEGVFNKSSSEAYAIMLSVHKAGRGIAGTYTREVAETKLATVTHMARKQGFPLQCVMEPM
ncbi:MAG: ATP-dependent Clp protease adapter ClpS [Acidobacteria bacterium]|nr:ATP-dependent Clp protease adapter ClpS [Acidobacteriota bacterium]